MTTTTKLKPNEKIGDNLPILAFQIKRIMNNCAYDVETKNEWVQWVTADVNRTSLKSITQAQAKKIIRQQEGLATPSTPEVSGQVQDNWASFSALKPDPKKRTVLFSLLYQAAWVVPNAKYGKVPDLQRLSAFLQSDKSPVKKPLATMEPVELEKVIKSFKGIIKHTWK